MAGQLLLAGFDGTVPSPEIVALIRDHGLGGVILYAKNCVDADQVAELTSSLQAETQEAGAEDPLFIAIDQEQGRVVRLREGVTLFPPMGEIARIGDPALVERVARVVSRELLALGINWNLAPVADVLSTPSCPVGSRSFGSDPALVSTLVCAYVRGAVKEGMISCAKHFPGHGATEADSHFTSPRIERDLPSLRKVDLPPFRAAIAAGVPSVMTTHITFPSLDAALPATFSPEVIDGLLRRELAFEGVVVSDDLEMSGSSENFPLAEGALLALSAGVDMILVSGMLLPERDLPGLLEHLGGALATGGMNPPRVQEALNRVTKLKKKYLDGTGHNGPGNAREILRCPEHLDLLQEVERRLSEEGDHAVS
jgi:beta-N-acetylhexosaminidase